MDYSQLHIQYPTFSPYDNAGLTAILLFNQMAFSDGTSFTSLSPLHLLNTKSYLIYDKEYHVISSDNIIVTLSQNSKVGLMSSANDTEYKQLSWPPIHVMYGCVKPLQNNKLLPTLSVSLSVCIHVYVLKERSQGWLASEWKYNRKATLYKEYNFLPQAPPGVHHCIVLQITVPQCGLSYLKSL